MLSSRSYGAIQRKIAHGILQLQYASSIVCFLRKLTISGVNPQHRSTDDAATTDSDSFEEFINHPLTQTGGLCCNSATTDDTYDFKRLPSVTRVLNATKPVESELALLAWKKKMIAQMGEERFNAMQQATLKAGKLCHSAIEQRLNGIGLEEVEVDQSCVKLWQSVQPVLKDVTSVKAVEGKYAHPHLGYYGFVDCVAQYKGELCSIDWKTSSKPRYTLSECYDDPLQVAAYAGAVNCSLGPDEQISRGVVVKIYYSGQPATAFVMNSLTLEYFWRQWLKRLHVYKAKSAEKT